MAEVSGYNKNIPNPLQQKPVNKPSDIAQTGNVKGSQQVQRAYDGTAETTEVQQPIPTIIRRMTPRDIVNQLLLMDIRPSAANRTLALKMLMNGLELSKENFNTIETLLSGLNRTAYTEQAAIILVNKGIPSKTGVQQLAQFLEQNPQLATQLQSLLANASAIQSQLAGQTVLSPVLTAQLGAIMSSFEGFISNLPKEIKDKMTKGTGFINKAELLTNLRAFRALVNGVSKQVEQNTSPEANSLLAGLRSLSAKAKEAAENFIVQSILSKPTDKEDSALQEKFAYWQIPNSMATPPQTLDLLIEKDKRTKHKTINPRKTKLILKTETAGLGEIAVEVDVQNDTLDFKFNTNEEEIRILINNQIDDLKRKLEKLNYKTKSVRVIKRNLDVKKFLIPTLDLNNLTRVQTEV